MSYVTRHYPEGTVRWVRWHGNGDVRSYQAPSGWGRPEAMLLDQHPITGKPLRDSQWWISEIKL